MVFNSQMGAFTQDLIKSKIPFKKIQVANQSKEEIKYFEENLSPKNRKRVDIHFLRNIKVPAKSGKVDSFVSFNDIGYAKDISLFIREVKKILNKKGKFCFYIKSSILNTTPNAVEVDNKKKMVALFKKEKLEVKYLREKKLFKTEVYIYGQKKS